MAESAPLPTQQRRTLNLEDTISNRVCNKKKISCYGSSHNFSSGLLQLFVQNKAKAKTVAGVPARDRFLLHKRVMTQKRGTKEKSREAEAIP
jgi:hypothetical protein